MYQRIVLAYDGSEAGQKALVGCEDIARWGNAELHLVAVMPSPAAYIAFEGSFYDGGRDQDDKRRFNGILEDGLRRLAQGGLDAKGQLMVGDPVEEVTEYARKVNADLIVVGHKHLSGLAARWWRGSSSSHFIERAHCTILFVVNS